MRVRIIKPGILSTIQDMGRHLHLAEAIPVSGVMDALSARIANMALSNVEGAALIEFTYADAEFIAETDLLIAYAGDGATLVADQLSLPPERPVFVPSGTTIKLVNNPSGSRTYLAVAGGWDVPEVLGSRSTFITAGFGGVEGRALQNNDVVKSTSKIAAEAKKLLSVLNGKMVNWPRWSIARQLLLPKHQKTIRVVPGREFTWFSGNSILEFLSSPYTLSMRSNRMGYHLEGPPIERYVKHELLSTAVTPGTIQVTGDGTLVLLMADCQTTGGYPRIAQVTAVDIPLCGQLKPGNIINFEEISRHEAEMLYLERENELQEMASAIKNKNL